MKHTLNSSNFEIIVNPIGAYIESLRYNYQNIFYPKNQLEINGVKKDRGGSHICLPLFGPNDIYGLNRHGFGRELKWTIEEHGEQHLRYTLTPDHEDFKDVRFNLEYRIIDNKFISVLTANNYSDKDVKISPAFHPYFAFKDFDELKIDGEKIKYTKKELADTVQYEEVKSFETEDFKINFSQLHLSKYAIWTDLEDKYICLEPTYNLVSKDYFVLKPGTEEKFYYEIEVNEK